jgi:hypothetical protein
MLTSAAVACARQRDVPGTAYQWGRAPDRNVGGLGMQLFDSWNLSGTVKVKNLNISDTYASALYLDRWPANFISLSFDGLAISNSTLGVGETRWHGVQPLSPAFGGEAVSPVVIMPGSCANSCDMRQKCAELDPTLPSGGVNFRRATIRDSVNRSWLSRMWTGTHGHTSGGLLPPPLQNISGRVRVTNPKGCLPAEFGPGAVGITIRAECVLE